MKEQDPQKKEGESLQEQGERLSGLKKRLEECEKEREEYLSGWKRARADLINYKKGERERVERFLKFSNQHLILKLLPLVDDLERAEERLSEEVKKKEEVRGVLQIKKKLKQTLKKEGLEQMELLGKKFDPHSAEAVEVAEGAEEGRVIEVLEKGYKLHGKVIRPAKVVVGGGSVGADNNKK